MRLALFGGTFDPVHRGHLAVAAAAADALSLDTILFAPTGRQPLKSALATAPFHDRLAMAALACAAEPRFAAAALDAPHPTGVPNYTVDLLAALHDRHPDATLFAIAGLDSFLTLPRWREPQRLLDLAEWIVVSRPGFTFADLPAAFHAAGLALDPTRLHPLDSVHEDVSATDLRERLRHGAPCLDLIPAAVSAYIQSHRLYP